MACNKDADIFDDVLADDIEKNIEENEENLVSKTVYLSPNNDAYLEEGKRFNENIIRIDPGLRTSYLMFDLSGIDGEIESVELQLSVTADPGEGTIKIHKGSDNEWTEESISDATTPTPTDEVASISKSFQLGSTEKIEIDDSLITNDQISFIITQESGNDVALAAKENTSEDGPRLKVTYLTTDTGDSTTEPEEEEEEEEIVPEEPPVDIPEDSFPGGIEVKAFPDAQGFGRYATGGRGGRVIEVTNLNDSGSGSLRDAITNTNGPRTIVFKVGGTIWLNSPLVINNGRGDITIAGQTAPGDGITIGGASFWVYDSNVIIQYLRFRPGNDWDFISGGQQDDAFRIVSENEIVQNVIVDHCSFSWGKDENIEIGAIGGDGVRNVTIQNSIIAENIDNGYGLILWKRANDISIVKNLFAHHEARCPESTTASSSFEMINNIIYGYTGVTRFVYENKADIINNYYKSAPYDDFRLETVRLEIGEGDGNRELTEAYIEGNQLNGNDISISSGGSNNLGPYLKSSPVLNSGAEVLSVSQILQSLPNDVGSSLHRDSADTRVVNDFINSTGNLIGSEEEVGGFPSIQGGNAYVDSDKDGMDDQWEINKWGDLSQDGDQDHNGNGYTNLEEFLYALTMI